MSRKQQAESLFDPPPGSTAPDPGPRKPRTNPPAYKPKAPPAPPNPRPKKPSPGPVKPRRDPKMKIVNAPPPVPAKIEPPPMNLLSLIGQALINPAIDSTKLREIVDWYDKREADNAFARDFLAMAKELPEIAKDGTIDQGITRSGRQGVKSKFATYENIHEATSAILHRNSFTLSSYNSIRGEQTVVVLRLEHYDPRFGAAFRESIRPIVRDDSGGKTSVQADGAGEQYLKRRMVINILHLRSRAPEDRDLDGNDPAKVAAAAAKVAAAAKPISAKELGDLRATIAVIDGMTEQMVCTKYGLAKLEEMTAATLPDALKALANFRANKAARNGT